MRESANEYKIRLYNGYDYTNQAWVINGKYEKCGHPEYMHCNCYGKLHAGEDTKEQERTIVDIS